MRRQTRIWLVLLVAIVVVAWMYMKQATPGSDIDDVGDNLVQDMEEETDSEKIEDKASVNIPGRPVADIADTEGATAASVTDAKTYQINQGSRFEWVIKKVDGQYE